VDFLHMQEGGPCVTRTSDLMHVEMGARHGKNDLKKKLRDELQVHNFYLFFKLWN
jgi:hypothetical protein